MMSLNSLFPTLLYARMTRSVMCAPFCDIVRALQHVATPLLIRRDGVTTT